MATNRKRSRRNVRLVGLPHSRFKTFTTRLSRPCVNQATACNVHRVEKRDRATNNRTTIRNGHAREMFRSRNTHRTTIRMVASSGVAVVMLLACTTKTLNSDPVSLSGLPLHLRSSPQAEQTLGDEPKPPQSYIDNGSNLTQQITTTSAPVVALPVVVASTTTTGSMLPVVTTTIPTTTTGKLFDPEVESWRDLVSVYFKSGDVERVLELIHCESSGNMYAQNPKKTLYGYAQGLLQHMTSLFPTRALEAKSAGYNNNGDVWNPADNLSVGAWLLYETRQGWNHWTCTKLLK